MLSGNGTVYKFKITAPSQTFLTKLVNPLAVAVTIIVFRIHCLFCSYKHLPQIIKNIQKIDKLLYYARHQQDENKLKLSALIVILFSFPFQILSLVETFNFNFAPTLLFGVNIYSNFSLACCELQFSALCFLIRQRFRLINESVSKLNPGSYFHKVSYENMALEKVKTLKKAHKKLFLILGQINNYFNVPLLFSVGCGFTNVLLNFYYAIFGGFESFSNKSPKKNTYDVFNDLIWAGYYFLRLVFICMMADGVLSEVSC